MGIVDSTPAPPVTYFRLLCTSFKPQNDHFQPTCDSSSVSNYPPQHHCIEHCDKQQGGLNVRELRLPVQQSHLPGLHHFVTISFNQDDVICDKCSNQKSESDKGT